MKLNLGVRYKNPRFWIALAGSVLPAVFAATQVNPTDLTTWHAVGVFLRDIVTNPYLLMSILFIIYGAVEDFTVDGTLTDSDTTMLKEKPTNPNQDIVVKGPEVVTDESEIIVDNTIPQVGSAEEVQDHE